MRQPRERHRPQLQTHGAITSLPGLKQQPENTLPPRLAAIVGGIWKDSDTVGSEGEGLGAVQSGFGIGMTLRSTGETPPFHLLALKYMR